MSKCSHQKTDQFNVNDCLTQCDQVHQMSFTAIKFSIKTYTIIMVKYVMFVHCRNINRDDMDKTYAVNSVGSLYQNL